MEMIKGKGKKGNLIIKTWERCKSLGHKSKKTSRNVLSLTTKSKSWPRLQPMEDHEEEEVQKKCSRKQRVAPEGCFSVYVGPQKQRFVIKTEYANHPLFKILLEEAESEYGYNPEGPLALPCNVDIFYRVLLAMVDDYDYYESTKNQVHGCGFSKKSNSYCLLSPSPLIVMNQY